MAKTIEKVMLGMALILALGICSILVTALVTHKSTPTPVSFVPSDARNELSGVDVTLNTGNDPVLLTGDDTAQAGPDGPDQEDEDASEEETGDDVPVQAPFGTSILTEKQAIDLATSKVNLAFVGDVTDVELEREDGRLVYAVEFTKMGVETDVKLDAKTGEVVIIESDLDEEDDD